MIRNSYFYDPAETLSYNKLQNMVLSARGHGKSFGWKYLVIDKFLKNGEQFVWVRRRLDDVKTLEPVFMNDLRNEGDFVNVEYNVKKTSKEIHTIYLDKKEAGYFIPLSTSSRLKSTPFPKVKYVVFDEFLIDKSKSIERYLPREPEAMNDLYVTINRERNDTVMVLIGNAVSENNPYFNTWNVKLQEGQKIWRSGEKLVQIIHPADYYEEIKKLRFYNDIDGTDYGNYVMKNEFLLDSKGFISEMPPKCNYQYTMKYDGRFYGLWYSEESGRMFLNENVDKTCKLIVALSDEDHSENTLFAGNNKKSGIFKPLLLAYNNCSLYFGSQRSKAAFKQFMNIK